MSKTEFETLVFRIIQDRAVKGYPNVRPDVDEIVAAHNESVLSELYWMLGVFENTKRPIKPILALKQRIESLEPHQQHKEGERNA